jgi:hypothetical protein
MVYIYKHHIRMTLLILALFDLAIFTAQYFELGGFVDPTIPSADSLRSGRFSFRYVIGCLSPCLLIVVIMLDIISFWKVQVWIKWIYFGILMCCLGSFAIQWITLVYDIIMCNKVDTGTSRCSSTLACCVESIRLDIYSKCPNQNAGPCTPPLDKSALETQFMCWFELVYVTILAGFTFSSGFLYRKAYDEWVLIIRDYQKKIK